ncbi:TadE family protein [Microlunatus soli]|nr:TadE family protein [Microlunatus soli]
MKRSRRSDRRPRSAVCNRRSQRGVTASTQFAVIFPALMLIIFGMIQAGIWLHARNVAGEAANAAADVARSYRGDAGRARQVAYKITAVGGLRDVTVAVVRQQGRVDVTLTGRAPIVFDIGLATVSESASAPLERVTTP